MTFFEDEITTGVLALFVIALILVLRAWIYRAVAAARAAHTPPPPPPGELVFKLSSQALAVMLVDSLVEHKLVDPKKADEAVGVLVRKIDLRKALGDF